MIKKKALKGMSRFKAGAADGVSIDLINQGCRRFSTRQTRNTSYQILANLYCTKCLEKHYNDNNSQRRHQRQKNYRPVSL